jgi:Ca2+-binding RTX toxin-like protein
LIQGTTDQLIINNYFNGQTYPQGSYYTELSYQNFNIQFNDGTTWDKTAIRNKVLETAIIGSDGNDTLTGGDTNDYISGGAGNDSIDAGAGNDLIEGGTGADTLNGGTGDDTYIADGSDTINEGTGEGTDTVQTPDDITLPDNVENLNQTGTGNTTGTGNASDNVLIGNSGNNQLNGTAGADALNGGMGNDSLNGGLGDDILYGNGGADAYQLGLGNDTVIYRYNQDGADDVIEDLTSEQINTGISDGIDIYKVFNVPMGFVAQIKFELGFSLTPYLSKNTLCRWRTQMRETV